MQQAFHWNTAGKNAFTNLSLLQKARTKGGIDAMAELIIKSIKHHGFESTKIFRFHEGGDFYSDDYFKAWIQVAKALSNITFYGHTTSLHFWMANRGSIPNNMRLIASMDEDNEDFIYKHNLRYAKVVYSVEEATQLKLKIDYDDTLACCSDESFALLIHGNQPAGSESRKAVSKLNKDGTKDKLGQLHKANKGKRDKLRSTDGYTSIFKK